MDNRRFDLWTRSLTCGLPRRETIKAIVSVAFVGAAQRTAVRRVAADNGQEVGDYCDDHNPCNKDKGLVCVGRECEKKADDTKCQGKGCKKKKGKKDKGHTGGGPIHDPAH